MAIRSSPVIAALLVAGALPASALAGVPRPVVSNGKQRVRLGLARSACWSDPPDSHGVSHSVCVDLVPHKRPDGTLRVKPGSRIRIDVRTRAKSVRLGGWRAKAVGRSGRYWSVRVPAGLSRSRRITLVATFPNEPELDYRFGPLRLAT